MTAKRQAKYRGSLLWNTAISTLAACAAEVLLVLNGSVIEAMLAGFGFPRGELAGSLAGTLLYVLVGILVFAAVFALLQMRVIRYTREISRRLQGISRGEFGGELPVLGDNELSDIAMQVNHMSGEIASLIEKEKEAEQTKNDLITNVAHDLRTPLTSILGYLDLLLSDRELAPQVREQYLRIAHDKAKYLQKMIEDLFGLTKLGYAEQTAHMASLDLIALLSQLLDEFYPVFEQNDMTYEFLPDSPHYVVEGDGSLLARLFDNLINNGIKYGKEGKELSVRVKTTPEQALVEVVNYGKVIPAKDLERIFDKFYRADPSRNSAVSGTGLGLAIAANIAKLHGGQIAVKSDLSGTVFSVTLPRVQPRKERTEEA